MNSFIIATDIIKMFLQFMHAYLCSRYNQGMYKNKLKNK